MCVKRPPTIINYLLSIIYYLLSITIHKEKGTIKTNSNY